MNSLESVRAVASQLDAVQQGLLRELFGSVSDDRAKEALSGVRSDLCNAINRLKEANTRLQAYELLKPSRTR